MRRENLIRAIMATIQQGIKDGADKADMFQLSEQVLDVCEEMGMLPPPLPGLVTDPYGHVWEGSDKAKNFPMSDSQIKKLFEQQVSGLSDYSVARPSNINEMDLCEFWFSQGYLSHQEYFTVINRGV